MTNNDAYHKKLNLCIISIEILFKYESIRELQ